MRGIRRVAAVAALIASVGAASGCSVYQDFTTSDFAKQDAEAIVAAASEAMQGVTSMRLTGPVRDNGIQAFIDVRLDQDESCTGSMRLAGSNIDIRRVGDTAWLKGEDGAFNRLSNGRLTSAQLKELSSKWLKVTDKAILRFCDLDAYLETFEIVEYVEEAGRGRKDDKAGKDGKDGKARRNDDLTGEIPTTVGEETDLAGQTVVTITGSPGGTHEEIAWVLSEAPHYVVKVESTSAQDGGTLSLSEFNEDVEVDAPDPKDVIRP